MILDESSVTLKFFSVHNKYDQSTRHQSFTSNIFSEVF
uniref:Uncharacterized protein n=1 Tax=Anguilla anguilla TaxID=7936 RepID=A0A0E9P8L5_ANGAN